MNRELLEEIVIRGGLALQAEDCAIRAAVHHRGEKGGILRMQNERYYQFIVWRAVLPVWPCEVERQDNTDLVVHSDNGMHHFEMKKYFGANGLAELPGIQSDILRLQTRQHGYMLLLSANPRNMSEENIVEFLPKKLSGIESNQQSDFRFHTQDTRGKEIEFWLAGWPVKTMDSPSSATI